MAESSIGSTTVKRVPVNDFYLPEPTMTTFTIENPVKNIPKPEKPIKQPKREKAVSIQDKIKSVTDNVDVSETATASVDSPLISENIPKTPTVETKAPVKKHSTNTVEFVPIFPGCESLSNNEERVACMSSKINKFISRNFDTEKFSSAIDRGEIQRINVQFTVNVAGNITEIKARSRYKPLEKEAIRVLKRLPTITPGKQGDRRVDVIYNVPIVFKMGY